VARNTQTILESTLSLLSSLGDGFFPNSSKYSSFGGMTVSG